MLNIVKLEPKNQRDMLDLLEASRRSIENGEVRSLIIVAVGNERSVFSGFAGAQDLVGLVGETMLLQHRLIDQVRANNDGQV